MKVTINGKAKTFAAPLDLQAALEQEGYRDMLVAAAINGNFVPKANYSKTALNDGDEIEIVAPMQGG
jgi:sulfur carrier protein